MAALTPLLDRRVLLAGGKGGVGKTTIAAAMALTAAERGRRVLVVSTDPAHSLGHIFERTIGDRVTRLAPNLDALEIDPEREADAHVAAIAERVRGLVRGELAAEADRQIRLARHAPGAMEAALLERIADIILDDERPHDLVVFDTAPIGHTLRLLELPELLAAWTDGLIRSRERAGRLRQALDHLGSAALGRRRARAETADEARMQRITELLMSRRRKFHRVRRILGDADATAFVLVTTPERLPIAETTKARELLEARDVPVAAVVVNRVLPDDAEGGFLATRRERERGYLDEIARVTHGLTRVHVPLLAYDVAGLESVRGIAALLFGEDAG